MIMVFIVVLVKLNLVKKDDDVGVSGGGGDADDSLSYSCIFSFLQLFSSCLQCSSGIPEPGWHRNLLRQALLNLLLPQ